MYYKLLNKNIISAALVSLITVGAADISQAQGVVTLVKEDAAKPQDGTAVVVNQTDDFDEFGFEFDEELPETIDDEIIPFDGAALISPDSTSAAADNKKQKPDQEKVVAPATDKKDASPKPKAEAPKKDTAPKPKAEDPKKEAAPKKETAPKAPAAKPNTDTKKDPAPKPKAEAPKTETAPKAVEVKNNNTANKPQNFDLGLEAKPSSATANKKQEKPVEANTNNNPLVSSVESPIQVEKEQAFANSVLARVDNELFTQMSDIEKQTTLLTLELRREKIRNEIEAIKAQRTKVEEEKLAAQKEKELKEFEWKKEQEAKVYKEQQKLKEKEIELEKIKQRKALNSYMNKMLEEKQVWIEENAKLLKRIKEVEEDRKEIAENFKSKLNSLKSLSDTMIQSANNAKSNHDRTVASLTAQNIQLKKRLEAEAEALQNAQQIAANGSLDAELAKAAAVEEDNINIAQEYAILDITGKGEELFAKLINKDGSAFIARKGTILQSGHTVEKITNGYIEFAKKGKKQYLYTGSSIEPDRMDGEGSTLSAEARKPVVEETKSSNIGDSSAPTLGAGMFVK